MFSECIFLTYVLILFSLLQRGVSNNFFAEIFTLNSDMTFRFMASDLTLMTLQPIMQYPLSPS